MPLEKSVQIESTSAANPYRDLPSVSHLLVSVGAKFEGRIETEYLTRIIQVAIDDARESISKGGSIAESAIDNRVTTQIEFLLSNRLAPIINATGILIHTNLGRSPVSAKTADAMARTAGNYVSLELDPESNQRGGRMDEISRLFRVLTGAEATLVVNNNASAVLLTLAALAANREVVVSRGEAVEIGGGFRIPDVLRQSGAILIEIGTTNRTYARDYEAAFTDQTAACLKVHPSNFTIEGFTSSASIAELVKVASLHGIPVIDDQGSGALIDVEQFGLKREPTISASIAAGASIVTASGDKLLGGPQAGIICGSADLVAQISRHPLARSVRADKTCLVGVSATLRHYLAGDAIAKVPILRMLSASLAELDRRANWLAEQLGALEMCAEVIVTDSSTGGGSLPGQRLESRAVAIQTTKTQVDDLARSLRTGDPGIFGRIDNDRLVLDLRSVLPEQDESLLGAIQSLSL
jgi:L-seryl-tRNA(Ser) seleniumtransferase